VTVVVHFQIVSHLFTAFAITQHGHVWRMVKVENSMRRILRWTDMRHKPFRSDCHVELDCYSSNRKTTLPEVIENASVAIWKYLAPLLSKLTDDSTSGY